VTDSTCDYIIVDGVNELGVIAEKAAYTIPNEIPV